MFMDIYFQLHLHFAGLGWLATAAAVVSILSWVGVTPQSLLHRFGLIPKPPAVVYERLPSPLTQSLVIVLPHRSREVCVVHTGGLHGSFAGTPPTRRACEDSPLSSAWRPACASWGGRPRRAVWPRRRGSCGGGSASSSRIRSAVHAVVQVACLPVAPARAAQGAPMPRSRWRGTRTGTTRPAAQRSDTAGRRSRRRAVARRHPGTAAIDLCSARRLAARGR